MTETAYSLYRRGSAMLSEGMLHEAAEALARARTLEPTKASIREALGRTYFLLGRHSNARAEFEAATKLDPTNDYAHFGLTLCLERQGDFDGARAHAKLAAAMRPDNEDYAAALRRIGSRRT